MANKKWLDFSWSGLARCQNSLEEDAEANFEMEYSIQGYDQTENGEVIFLLDETGPRTVENCKQMKGMLGGGTWSEWKGMQSWWQWKEDHDL
jgi:hypothetical protein